MGRLPPVRESDGRILPAIVHRVWHRQLPTGSTTIDLPYDNITLVSTTEHFLDIRHDSTSSQLGSITAGICSRGYPASNSSSTPAAPFHLQTDRSTGTWDNWICIPAGHDPFNDEPATAPPSTTTADLSGIYESDGGSRRVFETERGTVRDAATGRDVAYEELWETVRKMEMVPAEGQRAVAIVLKLAEITGEGNGQLIRGLVMRVAHVVQGAMSLTRVGDGGWTHFAVQKWMFDQENGWQNQIAKSTDEELGEMLEGAVLQCMHDIDALKLGGVIDAGLEHGGWMIEELSWSKTKAQLDEIERRKQAEEEASAQLQ